MGEVYEASSPAGPVAIKLLSQASLGNPNHVLRFLRELRTAAAIVAPNVVRVLEVGEDPVPYLVMERLEGKTLAEVLRSRRVMAPADVVEMIRQIGAGITAARAGPPAPGARLARARRGRRVSAAGRPRPRRAPPDRRARPRARTG
jgi:serine/threonine protein kinase